MTTKKLPNGGFDFADSPVCFTALVYHSWVTNAIRKYVVKAVEMLQYKYGFYSESEDRERGDGGTDRL